MCQHSTRLTVAAAMLGAILGCQTIEKLAAPSNWRNWSPDQAMLAYAQFDEDRVTIHNVRNCHYLDEETYVVSYRDKVFWLHDVQTVDFIVCPFKNTPAIAHTMLSFGIEDDAGNREHLAVSVEIRREEGEEYSAWKGGARQYELIYVIADERDVIKLRTDHWDTDVYLYPSTASPRQARDLFVDVMRRANKLAQEPEFYNTLTNNCTTNIVRHINRLKPNRISYNYRVLFTGHSDKLAYDLELIQRRGSFEQTRKSARINSVVARLADDPHFSVRLRERLHARWAANRRRAHS